MSSVAGFYNSNQNFLDNEPFYCNLLHQCITVMKSRGADGSGLALSSFCGLCSTRLAVTEDSSAYQPVGRILNGFRYFLAFDGEIYNKKELTDLLSCCPDTYSAVLLLNGFIEYGTDFIKKVNGCFSVVFYNERSRTLFLFRDRAGIKPLFYFQLDQTFLFASVPKGILSYPGVIPVLDSNGLNEVFSIGPARSPGCGVFKGMKEVLPGHFLICSPDGIQEIPYWNLNSHSHEDNYEKTVSHVTDLLCNAVKCQLDASAPACSFLSGGVDSSLISAICSHYLEKEHRSLSTFSFEFKDSVKFFKSNPFQPSLDAPYVKKMADFLGSSHHTLECTSKEQTDALFDSVKAHDLPNMADVDSSLLCFCQKVCPTHKIAWTGECADEIFGGYPWFHKEECLNADTFPWTMDLNPRKTLLSDDFIHALHMDDYVSDAYNRSVCETPLIGNETPLEKRRKQISYLNLTWFMQTLLNRMDRVSASSGLAARVPFADSRIIEYLWNVPWEMKAHRGIVKGLLRDAGAIFLPDEILYRKKSPYPKTYDTEYETLLIRQIHTLMEDSDAPILQFLDKKKLHTFLKSPSDYGKPWYGQLMAAPQMLAYLLQVNFWMKEYKIKILI